MVKELCASGTNYTDFLKGNGVPSEGFSSVVFYLDGDSTKGELDLPGMVSTLGVLDKNPNLDSVSWRINETCDSFGREAIVLHVPTVSLGVLGIDQNLNKPKKEAVIPTNGVTAPEKDFYKGKLYYILASRKGNPGEIYDLLSVIGDSDPEDIGRTAVGKAADMLDAEPRNIEVTWKKVEREFFVATGMRMLRNGRRLSNAVAEVDPRLHFDFQKYVAAKKSKPRNYR